MDTVSEMRVQCLWLKAQGIDGWMPCLRCVFMVWSMIQGLVFFWVDTVSEMRVRKYVASLSAFRSSDASLPSARRMEIISIIARAAPIPGLGYRVGSLEFGV